MIEKYLIGIGGIVVIMMLWVLVQAKWRDTFADEIEDDDVLAERRSCGSCGCGTVCKLNKKPGSVKEAGLQH